MTVLMIDTHVDAPRDYDECFRLYRDYIVALVTKMGIDDSRAEDVAHDILTRFFERDFLAVFDPHMVFTHHGRFRTARFKSFLTKFTITYVQGHRDKQRRLATREPLLMDAQVTGTDGGAATQSTWGEQHCGQTPSAEDDLLAGEFGVHELIAHLRDYVASVPRRSRFDTCDLVKLLDEVLRQIDECGHWDITELRKTFGVGSTAMHSWMWWLRENCANALECRLPTKRSHRR